MQHSYHLTPIASARRCHAASRAAAFRGTQWQRLPSTCRNGRGGWTGRGRRCKSADDANELLGVRMMDVTAPAAWSVPRSQVILCSEQAARGHTEPWRSALRTTPTMSSGEQERCRAPVALTLGACQIGKPIVDRISSAPEKLPPDPDADPASQLTMDCVKGDCVRWGILDTVW